MADLTGRDFPELRILPDMGIMRSLGLGQEDIAQALARNDLQPGAILLREGQYQYNVRLASGLNAPEDLEEIYLRKGERIIQLKDLATVRLNPRPPKGRFLHQGNPALNMAIIQQDGARFADLQAKMDTVLGQLQTDYPRLYFDLSRDQTTLLSASIHSLSQSLIWSVALASLVMGFFLRQLRPTLMIALSLPLSLLISMLIFYLVNLSLNVISLS